MQNHLVLRSFYDLAAYSDSLDKQQEGADDHYNNPGRSNCGGCKRKGLEGHKISVVRKLKNAVADYEWVENDCLDGDVNEVDEVVDLQSTFSVLLEQVHEADFGRGNRFLGGSHHCSESNPFEDFFKVVLSAVPHILQNGLDDAVGHRQCNSKYQHDEE